MLCMLIAYDADGNVVATLDHLVVHDENGNALGLVDFEAVEQNGPLRLRTDGSSGVWSVDTAVGSGSWPEWLGGKARDFKVEVEGKEIIALVHKKSGLRRGKAEIKQEIARRIQEANGQPADIRDIVGGPDRPIRLDDSGRTVIRGGAKSSPDTTQGATMPVVKTSLGNRSPSSR